MKKIVAIMVAAFMSSLAVSSQSVFPESDAIWNYHRYVNHYLQDEWIYGLSGDTVINEVTYTKLYLLNDTTLQIDESDRYLGGFRQEDKKIWFRPVEIPYSEERNRDYLFFDFSKEISEEIHYDYIYAQSVREPYFYVEFVIFGDYYKRITNIQETPFGRKFVIYEMGEFVEGIGSLQGMYGIDFAIPTDMQHYEIILACFKHQGEVKYMNTKCNKCFCFDYSGIEDKAFEELKIHVTPEKGDIRIEASPSDLPFSFEVIDIIGQSISSYSINTEYSRIPSGNHSGILLYRIKSQSGMVKTGKIITSIP